jgi:hypothetical protein
MSPKPNLPDEIDENLAKVEAPMLFMYKSFVKVLLFDQVLAADLLAGPLVQSNLT